jgi:hypothetical protein
MILPFSSEYKGVDGTFYLGGNPNLSPKPAAWSLFQEYAEETVEGGGGNLLNSN